MGKLDASYKVCGLNPNLLAGDLRGLPHARIAHKKFGIVGPSDRTCAPVRGIEQYRGKTFIVWDDHDRQTMDTNRTILEFFATSEIDYAQIEIEWRKLTEENRPHTSHVPPGSFVLLTGLPGSGKTTLSKKLAAQLGALHFDFSSFSKRIVGRHPLCQQDYARIGMRIEALISDYLNCGGSVIYDTTAINSSIRQHHFDAIPRLSPRTLVWVPTESNICHQRLSSQRPYESPDLRPLLTRTCTAHVRTYNDFVKDFEAPCSAIVVPNGRGVKDAGIIESLRSQH